MWIASGNDSAVQPTGAFAAELGASLLLLQLLTQMNPGEETASKTSNGGSGAEEVLKASVDAAREEEINREVELLEHPDAEVLPHNGAELQKLRGWQSPDYNRLLKATIRGNITDLTIVLDSMNVNLEHVNPSERWTFLEWAVALGHKDICHLLLERGANPQRITEGHFDYRNGFVYVEEEIHWPLRLAARFGQLEIASLLIQYGAEIPNKEPELMAKDRGYLKLAQFLCEWKGEEKCAYLV